MLVTEPEFLDWKQHRITRAFMKALLNDRDTLKEMLVAGSEDDNNLRGRIAILGLLMTMDYSDMMESLKENR